LGMLVPSLLCSVSKCEMEQPVEYWFPYNGLCRMEPMGCHEVW